MNDIAINHSRWLLWYHQNATNRTITLQVSEACMFSAMDYGASSVYILAATIESEHPPLHLFVHIQAGLDHRNSIHHRNMCCFLNTNKTKWNYTHNKNNNPIYWYWTSEHSNNVIKCTEAMGKRPMNVGDVSACHVHPTVLLPSSLLLCISQCNLL